MKLKLDTVHGPVELKFQLARKVKPNSDFAVKVLHGCAVTVPVMKL